MDNTFDERAVESECYDSFAPSPPGIPGLTYVDVVEAPEISTELGDDSRDDKLCDGTTIRQLLRAYVLSLPANHERDREFEIVWREHIWSYFGRRRADTLLGRNVIAWFDTMYECSDPTFTRGTAFALMQNAYEKAVLDLRLSESPFWDLDRHLFGSDERLAPLPVSAR